MAKASLATVGTRLAPVLGLHGAGAVQRVSALLEPDRLDGMRRLAGVALISVALAAATVAAVEFVDLAHAWLTFTQP